MEQKEKIFLGHSKSVQKYNSKQYESITFRVPAGEKEKLNQGAREAGESINLYIIRAINAKMEAQGLPLIKEKVSN